jgi:hypothetical protein
MGNLTKCFSSPYIGCGDPDNFTARFREFDGLSYGCVHIQGVGCGHRLDPYRIIPASEDSSNRNDPGHSSDRVETRAAVGRLHVPNYPLKEALEIEESDIQHEGKKEDDKKYLRAFKESEG